jgi:hypothetical protein
MFSTAYMVVKQPGHDHPPHYSDAVTDPATDPSMGGAIYYQQHDYGTQPPYHDSYGNIHRTSHRECSEGDLVCCFFLVCVAITMVAVMVNSQP